MSARSLGIGSPLNPSIDSPSRPTGLLSNRSVLSDLDVRSFLAEGTTELTVRDIVLELLKPIQGARGCAWALPVVGAMPLIL